MNSFEQWRDSRSIYINGEFAYTRWSDYRPSYTYDAAKPISASSLVCPSSFGLYSIPLIKDRRPLAAISYLQRTDCCLVKHV
ncbi:MAG TPA: hypothetical protein VFZ47_00965, partial [Chitinophagaceae bacterium]